MSITQGIIEDEPALSPSTNALQRHSLWKWLLRSWLYRCNLIIGTILVSWALFVIQASLNASLTHPSTWQWLTQWAETVWIIPIPIAAIFWLGWFLFAQPVRPDPIPGDVPQIALDQDVSSPVPARLVFRFVTRGDNVEILRESILAVHKAFERYPLTYGPYQIEIISECCIDVSTVGRDNTSVHVVPDEYVPANRSRFKARAMAFHQEHTDPQPEDWHIYLDEESKIDEVFLAGIYQFILHTEKRMCRYKGRAQGIIGQGTIIYHGGHWFFRGADAMRTGDDMGRFRLQYSLGAPLFGMHGSFIVVRGIDDARLSFDVGPRNSIAEDAAWALRAWAKGFRFAWVNGYLFEQPPQTVRDFVKQRSRWLIGIRLVLLDKTIPLRYRLCMGIFTYSWHLSLLPTIVALLALFTHTTAFLWVQFPANFVWSVFYLSYVQGTDMQVRRTTRFLAKKKPSALLVTLLRILAFPLAFGIFWYTFLEGISILYSCIRPSQGFFVIRKPILEVQKQEATQ